MPNVKELLLFEDNAELLSYTFSHDDILMWPFIRSYIYRSIAYPSALYTNFDTLKDITVFEKIKYIYQTIRHNPLSMFKKKNFDILIFNSGITNIAHNGKYFNRVSDYFSMLYPKQTLMIEDSYQRRYKRPRSFENITYHDMVNLKALVYSKLHKNSSADKKTIDKFIKFLKEYFPYSLEEKTIDHISNTLLYTSQRLKAYHDFYTSLFEKYRPKIIFLEDASYGQRSYIIKWAKEFGIKVAELQHGLVSDNHEAYCYSRSLNESSIYRCYLPDFFVTYGEYWSDAISHPANKVALGNPHLLKNMETVVPRNSREKSQLRIMFLTALDLESVSSLLNEFIQTIDSTRYQIVLRPHPLVRKKAQEVFEDICLIDSEHDLYKSLERMDFVVGEASTVIFEAIGMNKQVFVLDNPYADLCLTENAPLKRFKTASELYDLIQKYENEIIDNSVKSYIWADQWEIKFESFMQENGIKKQ